jgi:hypothetical protein
VVETSTIETSTIETSTTLVPLVSSLPPRVPILHVVVVVVRPR